MTRARDISEWVPDGTPTVGQGVLVEGVDPVVTGFFSGSIPFNAVIHVSENAPDAEFLGPGVFWLNPTAAELRVYLADRWLRVSLPEADTAGLIAMTEGTPAVWDSTDDIDGGTY